MSGSSSGPYGGPAGLQLRRNKPEWMLGPNDLGQVMVLVLRRKTDNTDSDNQSNNDAPLPDTFIVGTSIELVIGTKEARALNASREGRGSRYLLRASSTNVIDKLTKMTELTDGTKIEIVPHPTLNTVQGIVYDADSVNKDEKSIQEHLESQGVQAVRRIKKRVNGTLKNTPLLVLSFCGTILPDHVYFGLMRVEVRVYYPSPLLCFNCAAYGHSKKICEKTTICLRCSTSHDIPEGEQCKNAANCLYCNADHQVTSRDCPKFKEEEKIIRLKTDQGITFAEARRLCAEESKRQTYAGVIRDQMQQELAAKDLVIAALQKQVALLTKELASLKDILKPSSESHPAASQDPRPSTSTQKTVQQTTRSASQTERQSRKDQSSPTVRRRENQKSNKSGYGIVTRSKSGKRPMETSPTEAFHNPGKRSSVLPGTANSPATININNG